MKNVFLFFSAFLLITTPFFINGCSTISSDYKDAVRIDKITTWQQFLKNHPGSEYDSLARTRLQKLEKEKEEREELQKKQRALEAERTRKAWEEKKRSVTGYVQVIRSGREFPLHLFSVADIVSAFGKHYRNQFSQWARRGNASVQITAIGYTMEDSYGKSSSSIKPNVVVEFYNHPSKTLKFVTAEENITTGANKLEAFMAGEGLAIVTSDNKREIYEFKE